MREWLMPPWKSIMPPWKGVARIDTQDLERVVDRLNKQNDPSQTAKAYKGKLQITLVPRQIIRDIAIVRGYGNKKYGSSDNWKEVEIERYRDALCRHLLAYLDDPDGKDEESGLYHYQHMATNMAFICEMEKWRRDGKKM